MEAIFQIIENIENDFWFLTICLSDCLERYSMP